MLCCPPRPKNQEGRSVRKAIIAQKKKKKRESVGKFSNQKIHEYGRLNIKNSKNYCLKKRGLKKAVQIFQILRLVGGGQHNIFFSSGLSPLLNCFTRIYPKIEK